MQNLLTGMSKCLTGKQIHLLIQLSMFHVNFNVYRNYILYFLKLTQVYPSAQLSARTLGRLNIF